jgi:hypothetical protein
MVIMGTGRTLNKKPATRPVKSARERARRYKVQRARLVALGLDEAKVQKMNMRQVKDLLKRPKATAAAQA